MTWSGRTSPLLGLIGLAAVLSFGSAGAQAMVLLDEDFTGVTIANNKTVNLLNNPGTTSDDNLNTWIDFPNSFRWGIASGGICSSPCSGDFAQHLVQASDNTNLLFYAFDASGIAAGTVLTLDLDYINSSRDGRVVVAGMLNGQHSLDPFAPWFPPGDTNDGIVVLDETLATTGSWISTPTYEAILPQAFDALALGIIMGGTTGNRGVDNVHLATVPEPGTLALLSVGLVGFGVLVRRRRRL